MLDAMPQYFSTSVMRSFAGFPGVYQCLAPHYPVSLDYVNVHF
jgi:hypothetical protein